MRAPKENLELMTLAEVEKERSSLFDKILSKECTLRDAKRFCQLNSARDVITAAKQKIGQEQAEWKRKNPQ